MPEWRYRMKGGLVISSVLLLVTLSCADRQRSLDATVAAQGTLIARVTATIEPASTGTPSATPTPLPTATPTPVPTATPRLVAATPVPTRPPVLTSTPFGRPRATPTRARELTPAATVDLRKLTLVVFLNRFQALDTAMTVSVLVHVPRLQQGISILAQDKEQGVFLITGAIDLMVSDLERLLPLLRGLVPPPELAGPYGQYVQGAELFLDGLERMNQGLVENNLRIFNAGLADYARGDQEMRAGREGLAAVASQYGISYDEQTGVWK